MPKTLQPPSQQRIVRATSLTWRKWQALGRLVAAKVPPGKSLVAELLSMRRSRS